MLKIENTEVTGWEAAIRGMRNPMNSWKKSDSGYCQRDLLRDCTTCVHRFTDYPACYSGFDLGPNDFDLMTRLRNSGTDHRKFMRMITVYLDITAPLYWWKEFDTYKVGTVANSCSTMHKIHDKEFYEEDFSFEKIESGYEEYKGDDAMHAAYCSMQNTISALNRLRYMYNITKNKKYWYAMIQLLPSSYNQRRTVMLNYEVLANIYKSRKNHKLDEWHTFCDWIKSLPHSELITGQSVEEKG
jgi:hypothetical protein